MSQLHRCTHRNCTNIACGVYEVVSTARGNPVALKVLCAECALTRVANTRRGVLIDEGKPTEQLIFVPAVKSISTVHLFTSQYPTSDTQANGAKHWVEPAKVAPLPAPLAVYAPEPAPNSKVVTAFKRPFVFQSLQDLQRGE